MSSPSGDSWADRRALFQPGREVHEPAPPRRPSLSKPTSPQAGASAATNAAAAAAMPTASERRRSSASGTAGMFANLHSHKRGSEDYNSRRENWAEMNQPKGTLAKAFENMIKK